MVKYRLIYFHARGGAEPARYLFAEAGVDYEDVRYTKEEWETKKHDTTSYPFGQLPVLEVDGKFICQSQTICRYLGKQFGFYGKDDYEEAQADYIGESIKDWLPYLFLLRQETDTAKQEAIKQNLLNDKMPGFFKAYERLLGKNEYMVGNKCTWIDFVLIHILGFIVKMKADILNEYPGIKAYTTRVIERPKVKAWIAKRPETEN